MTYIQINPWFIHMVSLQYIKGQSFYVKWSTLKLGHGNMVWFLSMTMIVLKLNNRNILIWRCCNNNPFPEIWLTIFTVGEMADNFHCMCNGWQFSLWAMVDDFHCGQWLTIFTMSIGWQFSLWSMADNFHCGQWLTIFTVGSTQ